LNCHNVAKHCKFDARNSERPLLHGDDHPGIVYLDMLQQFFIPQLDEKVQEGRTHFQQDGAPPHYLEELREYLNTRFPGRWIGRAAPPRSPDLISLYFFLWRFVEDRVFVPPLPANVAEPRTRITAGRSCRSDPGDAT
jgi:hypothetical protein